MQLPEAPLINSPPRINLTLVVLGLESEEATRKFVEELLQLAESPIVLTAGRRTFTLRMAGHLVDVTIRQDDLKDYEVVENPDTKDPKEQRTILAKNRTEDNYYINAFLEYAGVYFVTQNRDEGLVQLQDFISALPADNIYFFGQKEAVEQFQKSPGSIKAYPQILHSNNKDILSKILKENVVKRSQDMINEGNELLEGFDNVDNDKVKTINFEFFADFPGVMSLVAAALAARNNADVSILNCTKSFIREEELFPFGSTDPIGDLCYALEKGNFVNLQGLDLSRNQLLPASLNRIVQTLIKVVKEKSFKELILNGNNLQGNLDSLVALSKSGKCADQFTLGIELDEIGVGGIKNLLKKLPPEQDLILYLGIVAENMIDELVGILMARTDVIINVNNDSTNLEQLKLLNERNKLIWKYPQFAPTIKESCYPDLYRPEEVFSRTPPPLSFLASKKVISSKADPAGLPLDCLEFIQKIKAFQAEEEVFKSKKTP